METIDFIIAGQGLAGTFLSHELLKAGQSVLVADGGHKDSAAMVGAGICNPVTGKRFVKTWKADEIFPRLAEYYAGLESILQEKFFFKKNILRILQSEEEKQNWQKKLFKNDYGDFISTSESLQNYTPFLKASTQAFEIRHGGWVNMQRVVTLWRVFLKEKGLLREEKVLPADIKFYRNRVVWNGIHAKKIIFCGGYSDRDNPFFKNIHFQPAKGELLTIHIKNFPESNIISAGIFILPLGNSLFKAGASNDWDTMDSIATAAARDEITRRLQQLLAVPFTVTGHIAGVRPALQERRPVAVLHSDLPLGIFNGLGAKGASLAPFVAREFAEKLCKNNL